MCDSVYCNAETVPVDNSRERKGKTRGKQKWLAREVRRERDKYSARKRAERRQSGWDRRQRGAWLKWITYCCPSLQHVVHLAVPAFQVNRITANLNEVTPPLSLPSPLVAAPISAPKCIRITSDAWSKVNASVSRASFSFFFFVLNRKVKLEIESGWQKKRYRKSAFRFTSILNAHGQSAR